MMVVPFLEATKVVAALLQAGDEPGGNALGGRSPGGG